MSCGERREPVRSAYWWSTTFGPSVQELEFLDFHNVSRLYLRYFDVVVDPDGEVMPNATLKFNDSIPEGLEVIPTVFIVNECMRKDVSDLPGKLSKRILQMNETNDVFGVKEIQIDCDWTRTTQDEYFAFLKELRKLLAGKGLSLSVTIRLHQLNLPAPPVDNGTLMIYNTGDVTDPECVNPILHIDDIKAYLPKVDRYRLHLNVAYPIFGWKVVYRDGKYVGILHYDGEFPLVETDEVRNYRPDFSEIMRAKDACRNIENEIILFDLNDRNLKNFQQNEYEEIYNRQHSRPDSFR